MPPKLVRNSMPSIRVTTLAVASLLLGCGGGGGGGDASGNGTQNPPANPGGGSAQTAVKIVDTNVTELARFVFLRAENLQFNGELMVSAAVAVQRDDDGFVELACSGGVGAVTIRHVDSDGNDELSATDSVLLNYADCGSVSGQLTLSIDGITRSGVVFDELDAAIEMRLEIDDGGSVINLESSQALAFSIQGDEIRWSSHDARFESSVGGARSGIRGTTIERAVVEDTNQYSVSVSGTADYFGESLTFATTSPLRGGIGTYPELGIIQLRGDASAADLLHGDRLDIRPTEGRFRVDSTGGGLFDALRSFDWTNVGGRVFFGVDVGSENYGPPPGGVDVTTRTSDLGGTIGDVAVDVQRNLIYFSITDRNEVAVVDGDSLLVIERVFVGAGPRGVWLSDDGATLYSALSGAGSVSALDLATRTLEVIPVAQAIGTSVAHDVVEVSPGVLFVTGSPGSLQAAYVARVDRAQSDRVTRIADGRSVGDGARIIVNDDRSRVYVAQGLVFFELDPTDSEGRIVVDGRPLRVSLGETLSISPDGATLYFDEGDVRDAATFEKIGELPRGIPYALPNGHEIALVDGAYFTGAYAFNFDIYSTVLHDRLDRFSIDCGLDRGAMGLVPLREEGQWLFYSTDGICAGDILHPDSPPGSDGEGIPPTDVPRVSVSAIQSQALDLTSVVYDGRRQRLFTVDDDRVLGVTADMLEIVDTYDVGGRAEKIVLSPSGQELAIAFSLSPSLGFLQIDTGQLEMVNFSEPLGLTTISDVVYLDDDTLYLSAWGGPTDSPMLVRASRSNTTPAIHVLPEVQSVRSFSLVASAQLQRLYASTIHGPGTIYSVDVSQPSHPLVVETEATVRAGDTFELSPDASLLALGSGELFSPSDLTARGTVDRGALGFSGDSRYAATAVSEGELHIFSAATFTKTLIVETGCGQSVVGRVLAIPEQDAWVLKAGSTLCRFSMPQASQTIAAALKTSLGSSRYYCGDDCVVRKRVAPAVMRASQVTRYLPWTIGGAVPSR
jgi:DNA-binding beta-propeller fold protein YncE